MFCAFVLDHSLDLSVSVENNSTVELRTLDLAKHLPPTDVVSEDPPIQCLQQKLCFAAQRLLVEKNDASPRSSIFV